MAKSNYKAEIKGLDEIQEVVSNALTDQIETLPRARTSKSKRIAQRTIDLWASIEYYFQILEVLTADELEEMDKRLLEIKEGSDE